MSQEEGSPSPTKKARLDEEILAAGEGEPHVEERNVGENLTPQHIQNLIEWGGVLLATQHFQDAANVFNLIFQATQNTEALYFRGFSQFYLGQNEEAVEDVRAAIDQEPDPERKEFFRSGFPLETRPVDEAVKFERWGLHALLWGDRPRAIEFYNQSIENRPTVHAFWGRGLTYFLIGNLQASLTDLQNAIDSEQDPEEKSFFIAEKLFVLDCLGEFFQTRQLWRNVHLGDDENLFIIRYSQFKSLVCGDDVGVEEVKEAAVDLFNRFAACEAVEQERNIKTLRSLVRLLEKYIFTLTGRDVEALSMVMLVADKLMRFIGCILKNFSVRNAENKFTLHNVVFERLIHQYFLSLSNFLSGVRGIPGVAAAVKNNYEKIGKLMLRVEFNAPSVFHKNPNSENSLQSFLKLVSRMPALDSVENVVVEEENPEQEIQSAQQALDAMEALPRQPAVMPRLIFQQIQARNHQLLYGGYADQTKQLWRINHFLEFLHILPEFSGTDYGELFLGVRHEMLVANCRYVKIQWLAGEPLVNESRELLKKCEQIFSLYQECVHVIEEQNEVAKKVIRNSVLFFRYEQLDELLVLLTKTAERLLGQSLDLALVREILGLADTINKECHSLLNGENLSRQLLRDDNVLPCRAKDFVVAHRENLVLLTQLQKFDFLIREQEKRAKDEPLTLLYGRSNLSKKKTVVAVPFSRELSLASLQRVYSDEKVDSAKNLIIGFVFTIAFSADCDGGRKYFVKHISIRMSPQSEFLIYKGVAAECKKSEAQQDSAVLKNICDGFEIFQREKQDSTVVERNLLAFSPSRQEGLTSAQKATFDRRYHTHSEQSGVFWLIQKLDEVAAELIGQLRADPDFQRNGKVGMIAIDMLSDKSSCDPCKLSILALQASNGEASFRGRLENKFREAGMNIAKSGLKLNSRIFSRQPYLYNNLTRGDTQKGVNPIEKNVAHLKNLGIFQFSQPGTTLMSGNNPQSYSTYKKT